jgi:hypothetical protein
VTELAVDVDQPAFPGVLSEDVDQAVLEGHHPVPAGFVDPLTGVVEVTFVGGCAVRRRRFLAGVNPARQKSLQPVAIGAGDGGNDMA